MELSYRSSQESRYLQASRSERMGRLLPLSDDESVSHRAQMALAFLRVFQFLEFESQPIEWFAAE